MHYCYKAPTLGIIVVIIMVIHNINPYKIIKTQGKFRLIPKYL